MHHWMKSRPLFSAPSPRAPAAQRREIKVLPLLWRAVKYTCFFIGASVLVSIIMLIFTFSRVGPPSAPALPSRMVVVYHFQDALSDEERPKDFFWGLEPDYLAVRQMVDALDRAGKDERVKGFLARMDSAPMSISQVQELRAAIKRFRAGGKFAYIYSPSLGDGAGGTSRFYLASAFEERWMQPMGVVSINGAKLELPYARAALDWLGVRPQFFKRKGYKTAYENLTDETISPQNAEMMQDILQTVRQSILADVPQDIGVTPQEFERLVDLGLFPANEALKAKLITHSDYGDVLLRKVNNAVTGDPESKEPIFVELAQYYAEAQHLRATATDGFMHRSPHVAIIHIEGPIVDTADGAGFSRGMAAADEIAPAILDAADDQRIRAVVLRVDSPGGSPTASESILRAVSRVKEKGKPVIVSMGSAAASGGYWVSAYADRIFALPTTLTGSIGVLGGKFSAGDLMTKLHIKWENAGQWGRNAGMWSVNTPFDESESARINAMLDQVYDGFVERVAKGRKMAPEQVERVAQGRVWTGAQAVRNGLVDEIGGFDAALDFAARQAGEKDRSTVRIVLLPEPQTPLEAFLETLRRQGHVLDGGAMSGSLLNLPQPLAGMIEPALREMAVWQSSPVLAYEPLRLGD